jgi:NAD-dependent SIR2 family protein deacetylase
VITQNVDGLHQAAGARDVTDLHGRLDRVRCLDCGRLSARDELHARLAAANADWHAIAAGVNPDGDVDLADSALAGFRTVDCDDCAGVLKPDVVSSARPCRRTGSRAATSCWPGSRSLLVLGSSLTVMSGHRFVLRAARDGRPVAIVNQGTTRRRPVRRGHRRRPARARCCRRSRPGSRPDLTPALHRTSQRQLSRTAE